MSYVLCLMSYVLYKTDHMAMTLPITILGFPLLGFPLVLFCLSRVQILFTA